MVVRMPAQSAHGISPRQLDASLSAARLRAGTALMGVLFKASLALRSAQAVSSATTITADSVARAADKDVAVTEPPG